MGVHYYGVARLLADARAKDAANQVAEDTKARFDWAQVGLLIDSVSPDRLEELEALASERDEDYEPAGLGRFLQVRFPNDKSVEQRDKLFAFVDQHRLVSRGSLYLEGVRVWDDASSVEPHAEDQRYLESQPLGIGALEAHQTHSASLGKHVDFVDVESAWGLEHEDIKAHKVSLICGQMRNGTWAHGTKVLGVVCALDNRKGCLGIAPKVSSVRVASWHGSSVADAITAGSDALESSGGVLLVEVESPYAQDKYGPVELTEANFAAIRLATGLRIHVVEAAGISKKGSMNLDAAKLDDSRAVMVSAATSFSFKEPKWRRMDRASYGTRVNCFAWGREVWAPTVGTKGATTGYTKSFSGTSSAAAIVAGAAVSVVSSARDAGKELTPVQLRTLLSSYGTPAAKASRIGVMPDLVRILRAI